MKLEMIKQIEESFALDGEGYCIKRGAEHWRFKVGVANRTWPIQDRERDGESKIR